MIGRRIIDLCAALPLLLALLLLLPVVWIAGRIHNYPTLFFRQTRIGAGGRPIRILKFRSLRKDGNDASAAGTFRLLRRIGVDELPQALHVLSGTMSCVGPRPLMPRDLCTPPNYSETKWKQVLQLRQSVKPGLTGVAQVSFKGRSRDCDAWRQFLEVDLWYVRHQSLRLDLLIYVLTPLYAASLGRLTFPTSLLRRKENGVNPSVGDASAEGANWESFLESPETVFEEAAKPAHDALTSGVLDS